MKYIFLTLILLASLWGVSYGQPNSAPQPGFDIDTHNADAGAHPAQVSPNIQGKVDRTGTAVNDDDCTGEQGTWWWDSTDTKFEFCNANSGVPDIMQDTNADTMCSGSTTYLDGDGNCDDISATYVSKSECATYSYTCANNDVLGSNCGPTTTSAYINCTPLIEIAAGARLELMAVAAGYEFCVMVNTAGAAGHVDPNASDRIRLKGSATLTSQADGVDIVSTGVAGDVTCIRADSADGWTGYAESDDFIGGS